jgi:hypothetical protein
MRLNRNPQTNEEFEDLYYQKGYRERAGHPKHFKIRESAYHTPQQIGRAMQMVIVALRLNEPTETVSHPSFTGSARKHWHEKVQAKLVESGLQILASSDTTHYVAVEFAWFREAAEFVQGVFNCAFAASEAHTPFSMTVQVADLAPGWTYDNTPEWFGLEGNIQYLDARLASSVASDTCRVKIDVSIFGRLDRFIKNSEQQEHRALEKAFSIYSAAHGTTIGK